jgi:hypothetical protein
MLLYEFPKGLQTRWFSPENPLGLPGQGAKTNRGGKGRASVDLAPGKELELMRAQGPGVLRRIWLTVSEQRDPKVLTGLRLRMAWDGAKKPAVDCPLNDFFGMALGRKAAFESAFFSDPEGRSFNCFLPMPFKKSGRAWIHNGSGRTVTVFYELNATLGDSLGPDTLYLHAHSSSESPNRLGRDYLVLPEIRGRGRYLGANFGFQEDKRYAGAWFGEGELKLFLDGDKAHPTLCGTGTEDMIGSAWGQGEFRQDRTGCTLRDKARGQWCFYRYHTGDPVLFHSSLRVQLQVLGGAFYRDLRPMIEAGAPLKIVSVTKPGFFVRSLESGLPKKIEPDAWCNFWRQDSLSSTAYYYLDAP